MSADPDLAREDRASLAEQYAVSAVRLLDCAKRVGYFGSMGSANRLALEKNRDLDILRSRTDYKDVMAGLP